MTRGKLSKVRREVGAKGLAARWGGRSAKATACLRVYPADAEVIKARAKASGRLPADEVAAIVAAFGKAARAEPGHQDKAPVKRRTQAPK